MTIRAIPSTITSLCNSHKLTTVGPVTHWADSAPVNNIVSTHSSRGQTRIDRFAKPDLLAPGGRLVGLMNDSHIAMAHPEFRDADGNYYLETLAGQSMLWSESIRGGPYGGHGTGKTLLTMIQINDPVFSRPTALPQE